MAGCKFQIDVCYQYVLNMYLHVKNGMYLIVFLSPVPEKKGKFTKK